MRVTCQTTEEFLECLSHEKQLYQDAIRFSVFRRRESEAKLIVTAQMSCIVNRPDGTEYLLEAGVECGADYTDGGAEKDGSLTADRIKERLIAYGKDRGFIVLPGRIQP